MASLGSDYYEKASVVKGHHVYKAVWTPFLGEELSVQPEDHNDHDEHAIAVTRDGRTVGHVPRIISRESWFFLRRGGHIICRITGQRKRGDGNRHVDIAPRPPPDPAFIHALVRLYPAFIRRRRLIEEIRYIDSVELITSQLLYIQIINYF